MSLQDLWSFTCPLSLQSPDVGTSFSLLRLPLLVKPRLRVDGQWCSILGAGKGRKTERIPSESLNLWIEGKSVLPACARWAQPDLGLAVQDLCGPRSEKDLARGHLPSTHIALHPRIHTGGHTIYDKKSKLRKLMKYRILKSQHESMNIIISIDVSLQFIKAPNQSQPTVPVTSTTWILSLPGNILRVTGGRTIKNVDRIHISFLAGLVVASRWTLIHHSFLSPAPLHWLQITRVYRAYHEASVSAN